MRRTTCCFAAATFGLIIVGEGLAADAPVAEKSEPWSYRIEIPLPPRGPQVGHLWLPPDVKTVRGLFYPGTIVIGSKLARDPAIRSTLAEKDMGLLFFTPGLGLSFIRGGGERLEKALAELAEKSGHPEVEFAPLLTAGHSTDGIFCRNVAYWKPHRVIGVLMLKSGNFHHHIEDMSRSLAGVPLTMISGEFEEYGPEGGDLGVGLRSGYSSHPTEKKKLNQTQWVMARMQMLGRRKKNEDNLWSLIVHRGRGHTSWDGEMRDLAAAFIRSCADARIPKEAPDGKTEVRCTTLRAKDGWLFDADIKTPKHAAAPYDDYAGDRSQAFWVPDKKLAEAVCSYHNRGWEYPDPTASDPPEERFGPPAMLRDLIDSPPPRALVWKGGDGAWDAESPDWREGGKPGTWNAAREAVFDGDGGTIVVATNLTTHGLRLGAGYTLDVRDKSMRCRSHAELDEGSTLRVLVSGEGRKGRAGRVRIDGNATLGGALEVVAAGEFPRGGKFAIMSVSGLEKGKFSKIILPEGWQTKRDRWGLNVVIPKPSPAKPR